MDALLPHSNRTYSSGSILSERGQGIPTVSTVITSVNVSSSVIVVSLSSLILVSSRSMFGEMCRNAEHPAGYFPEKSGEGLCKICTLLISKKMNFHKTALSLVNPTDFRWPKTLKKLDWHADTQ